MEAATEHFVETGTTIPIMEQFYTIQGEGQFSGTPAYFIRLSGCDVGCHWCDVKESWQIDKNSYTSIPNIIQDIKQYSAPLVVVTGGEPCMHNLDALTYALKDLGLRTHIETSGSHPITGVWDWICLSPKKYKAPLLESYSLADELKVIIYNNSDFEYAEQQAHLLSINSLKDTILFLQPEWSKSREMTPKIIEYVKMNPKWKISLQIHKYLNIP